MTGAGVLARPKIDAEAVLESHFTLVDQPGDIDILALDGATGWTSANPHPVLSLMRWTTTDESKALAALTEAIDFFRAKGCGFDWMTGPQTEFLIPKLQEAGFLKPPLPVGAMVLTIDGAPDVAEVPGYTITKLDDPDNMLASDIMSEGFDVPSDVGAIYHRAYVQSSPLQSTDVYLATEDASGDPVAVGYLSHIAGGPAVLLRVSSTLESHRGQGLYRALVQHRIRDAAHAGRQLAYVHAYSPESRRALMDLGFSCAGELYLHRWRP